MEKQKMSTIDEIHIEREEMDKEYQELCANLTQAQTEDEKKRIERKIELNLYEQKRLRYKELREKLLNVKDNKERNEVIKNFVEETKDEPPKNK